MALTLGQAALAVGKSKTTISRAISSGKLSATRLPTGVFSIEPVELSRAFPPAPSRDDAVAVASSRHEATPSQREIDLLREMLAREREVTERERMLNLDLQAERDRLLAILEQDHVRLVEHRPWWGRWRR